MPWNDPAIVSLTPIATTLLLEGANVAQVVRMIRERRAEGQSIPAWIMVNVALIAWLNFYRVCTPDQRWAIYATAVGIALNTAVILTVCYFRFVYPRARSRGAHSVA